MASWWRQSAIDNPGSSTSSSHRFGQMSCYAPSFGCGPTAQPPAGNAGCIVPFTVAFMLPQIQGSVVVSSTSSKLKRQGLTSRHRIIPGDLTVPLKRRNAAAGSERCPSKCHVSTRIHYEHGRA